MNKNCYKDRDLYNIPVRDCVYTLQYGNIPRHNAIVFLGDDIYSRNKKQMTQNIPVCDVNNTYIDINGQPKYSLPLHRYSELSKLY